MKDKSLEFFDKIHASIEKELSIPFEERDFSHMPSRGYNGIDYWYPRLKEAGIFNMPATIIFKIEQKYLTTWLDYAFEGKISNQEQLDTIRKQANDALEQIRDLNNASTVFLRHSLYSGKHSFENCCLVKFDGDILKNMKNISYSGEGAGCPGLPWDIWAVREWINGSTEFVAFGSTPIRKEFRFFYEDGKISGYQPYWPEEALQDEVTDNFPHWKERLQEMNQIEKEERDKLVEIALQAGQALYTENAPNWSIDLMKGWQDDWWLTDVALAETSFRCDQGFREL